MDIQYFLATVTSKRVSFTKISVQGLNSPQNIFDFFLPEYGSIPSNSLFINGKNLLSFKRILLWSNGYYNGAIKTRKTIQPTEDSAEEASLQRSQQLIELYDSLSSGETNHQERRPSAALSPEDLTESEWFYLICASFSFPPGTG